MSEMTVSIQLVELDTERKHIVQLTRVPANGEAVLALVNDGDAHLSKVGFRITNVAHLDSTVITLGGFRAICEVTRMQE